MDMRTFGKIGEEFPILGFGGQRIVDEHNCTEDEAIQIVNTALDRGIKYFDTAWIYSQGQAETRLGKVVKDRRSEMWLATKTWDTTRDGAREQLETSFDRLQTDRSFADPRCLNHEPSRRYAPLINTHPICLSI